VSPENVVTQDSFMLFLEMHSEFCTSKSYQRNCPAIILETKEPKSLLEMKKEFKADYVHVEKDLNKVCISSATILEKEALKRPPKKNYIVTFFSLLLLIMLLSGILGTHVKIVYNTFSASFVRTTINCGMCGRYFIDWCFSIGLRVVS
jgi:hypothetical protein